MWNSDELFIGKEMFDELLEKCMEEKDIPYARRSPEDKKKIQNYDEKMTTSLWKNKYDNGEDRHWMEDLEPSPLAKEVVDELKAAGIKGANVLEIGIGNGRDSIYIAKEGHNVVGIDIANEPVRVTQKKAKDGRLDNATFEIGDAEKLRYDDATFDAVYSVAAVHSTLLDDTLSQIYRVLKPGGTAKLFLYTKIKTGPKWINYWSPVQIKNIANKSGFKIKKFREGHRVDSIEIPGVDGEVEQENHFVVTTLQKPEKET